MSTFYILAALMTIAALMFILPALLRKETLAGHHALRDEVNLNVLRDQLRELDADLVAGTIDTSGYESSKQELQRRVLEDVQPGVALTGSGSGKRWSAVLLGLALPVAAGTLYFLLGTPAGLDPSQVKPTPEQQQAHAITEVQIANMVGGLAQRLKTQPNDIEGWSMLARSYNTLGRFSEAVDAYAHLATLIPDDADMLADYADTLAMVHNKDLQGEPEKLLARALAADPKNVKALALSGSAAFERHAYPEAVAQWKKVLALSPPDSEMARTIASGIGEAQSLAGGAAPAMPASEAGAASTASRASATGAASAATEVAGTVELDPTLRAKVADDDTVFIFARAAQGPRFPLAVLRKQVKDLPLKFVLDDSMSMVPTAKLSGFPMVVVGARISKSGSATPGAGDFEGIIEPVAPGARGLKIVINSQRK